MALVELLAALEQEGSAEAAAIEERARVEARALIAGARVRLADQRDRLNAPKEARLKEEIQRQVAEVRRSARRTTLLARHRLIERVYRTAGRRLARLVGDPRLEKATPKLVSEALGFVGGDATVDTDTGLGVVVTSADGRVTVDNTLEGRMRRLGPQLALEIVQRAESDT